MASASSRVNIQDLPFNSQVEPLYIGSEVAKLQRAMRQSLNLESSSKTHSRVLAIHHGARQLRYLCVAHTP